MNDTKNRTAARRLHPRLSKVLLVLAVLLVFLLPEMALSTGDSRQPLDAALRRVNAPYVAGENTPPIPRRAIFWFGQVTPTSNYADGRVAYNDRALYVTFHIFDQDLWHDTTPAAGDLTSWDAVSLYLDLAGNGGTLPRSSSYRFVIQLHNQQDSAAYQSTARGDGSGWIQSPIPFTAGALWRGGGLNDNTGDRGWGAVFEIPFSSLGLAGPPAEGARWSLAAVVHDRDDAAGTPRPLSRWPEASTDLAPATWGELHFGMPAFVSPPVAPRGVTTIRHGLNGAVVEDAHVGGHANCGEPVNPQFFSAWGDLNYAGYEQINIQNQWDVADWPCFSKFYVTFPLASLPPGSTILRANLTLHQFGNANPAGAQPSLIQVLAVGGDWDEATISWNNAPLAVENVDTTLVQPIPGGFAEWPGVPYQWDVSRAVVQAGASGQPLRLVLYSADGAYHSGKYFSSSDVPDWNQVARPTLTITWGLEGVDELDQHVLLPLVTALRSR
jgi:hypothetical protein